MKISPLPTFFLIFFLPIWPNHAPQAKRFHPHELPQKVLELIPGVGPKLAFQLKQPGSWLDKPGVGPKTREKLLVLLKPE